MSIPSSSSSSHPKKSTYGIVLSYAAGTHEDFTDNLCSALNKKGIQTFRDDNSQGEDSPSELLGTSIEGSWGSIIIISDEYVFSGRCLDVLVEIINHEEKWGRVYPIFYYVKPSHLIDHFDIIEETFKHHDPKKYNKRKTKTWQRALGKVAEIHSRWAFEDYADKNKSIRMIIYRVVKDISNRMEEEGYSTREIEVKNQSLRSSGREYGNLDFPQQRTDNKTLPEEKDKYTSSGSRVDNKTLPDLNNNRVYSGTDGCTIGKIHVSSTKIAVGGNGTTVFEGSYEHRAVAVKRLLKEHHEIASKEIENLNKSDWHTNIVRWHAREEDKDFVYLALERCDCSVGELIQIFSSPESDTSQISTPDMIERMNRLNALKDKWPVQVHNLWQANGHPSPLLLKLMKDIVKGLAHLHRKGIKIIHRDLKPQNVLVMIKEETVLAKIADMSISKRLPEDQSSLGTQATGSGGTTGWKAPEQLKPKGRQTRAIDLFSLGCVLFYFITRGKHPFGIHYRRDANVLDNNIVNLSQVNHIPEASDLISRLLEPEPKLRPKALEVLNHPLFWDSDTRLSFYKAASDRVQPDIKSGSVLLTALEATATVVECKKWDQKLNSDNFVDNIKSRRLRDPINFNSVRELVRVIRSKSDHYDEQTPDIKNLLGSYPEGYYDFFASKFPKLFIEVYKVFYTHCRGEDRFKKYFEKEVA